MRGGEYATSQVVHDAFMEIGLESLVGPKRAFINLTRDFILQDYAGNIVAIEVKSKQTAMAKDFKGLKKLQELVGDKFVRGVVLYAGDQVVPFGKHLHAVPISCLWQ